jgi:hypothetical protein
MRALARRGHPAVPQLALVAYLATAAAFAVLVSPFEDKGLSFGLILILAVVLAERAGGVPLHQRRFVGEAKREHAPTTVCNRRARA